MLSDSLHCKNKKNYYIKGNVISQCVCKKNI